MTQKSSDRKRSAGTRNATPHAKDNTGRHTYNALFVITVLLFVAFFGYQLLHQSDSAALALNSDGQTNTIPASGASTNSGKQSASDTDIAGLRAAETGQLGEPALVWFHADW